MIDKSLPRRWQFLLVLLPLLSGCGPELPYDVATVTGTVTYQGKALDHGQVVFIPEDGTPGPQAVGLIKPDGSFEMKTRNTPGVAVGKHRVTVHCRGALPPGQELSLAAPPLLVPEKYTREGTSPLSREVKKGDTREFDIVLE